MSVAGRVHCLLPLPPFVSLLSHTRASSLSASDGAQLTAADQVCEVLCTDGTFLCYGILIAKDLVLMMRIDKPRPEDKLTVRFTGVMRGVVADEISKGTALCYAFLRLQHKVNIRPIQLLTDEWKLHTALHKRGGPFSSILRLEEYQGQALSWLAGVSSPTYVTEAQLKLDYESMLGSPLLTGKQGIVGIICQGAPNLVIKIEHIFNDLMQPAQGQYPLF
jgi:hypothetical protein